MCTVFTKGCFHCILGSSRSSLTAIDALSFQKQLEKSMGKRTFWAEENVDSQADSNTLNWIEKDVSMSME